MKRHHRLIFLALFSGVLVLLLCAPAESQDNYSRSPHLGIVHISAPNDPLVDQRYRNALFLGAGWNRWPLYWSSIVTETWVNYDKLVANDVRYGLRSDAIFLGTPGQYADGGSIRGLYEAIFSDGSDTPGIGKQPNPDNPYASFVYSAVMRYKPGGVLARQLGWRADQGIRVWEVWNEPDLGMFWGGSVEDYARLLKISYLIVRATDPLAQVMFAGLSFNNPSVNDYLLRTLAVIAQDPQRATYNWYFDIAAVHSYTSAERSGRMVKRMKQDLAAYGLDRPVWLNESGAPVWDDYPGPTWTAGSPANRQYRLTQEEQALYVVESTALAWASGADVVFIFQLYDDCGNQAAGTNFPPNSGQAGDAYGLFRNDTTSPCFSQSPQPNTPRPAASAYYRMAQIFGDRNFQGGARVDLSGQGVVVSFDLSPAQGVASFGSVTSGGSGTNVVERAYIMWNNSPNRIVVEVPSSGPSAQLYDMGSQDYMLAPQGGLYDIGLPAVAGSDFPQLTSSEVSTISGSPFILIEQVQPGWIPVDPNLIHLQGQPTPGAQIVDVGTVSPEIAIPLPPTATPLPRPTLDPSLDHAPPIPLMQPLDATSPATFTLHWGGMDDSGIATYIV
ncbi:MAG: hypothetical protein ABI700_25855, partial [Chloroflexota bacterium]